MMSDKERWRVEEFPPFAQLIIRQKGLAIFTGRENRKGKKGRRWQPQEGEGVWCGVCLARKCTPFLPSEIDGKGISTRRIWPSVKRQQLVRRRKRAEEDGGVELITWPAADRQLNEVL